MAKKTVRPNPRTASIKEQDPKLWNMKCYFKSLDWRELWEKWYLTLAPNGLYQYVTVRQFVLGLEVATNDVQREFLIWYLGPIGKEAPKDQDYSFIDTPQDWIQKRETGGWISDKTKSAYGRFVTQKLNVLQRMEEVGQQALLHDVFRAEQAAAQIDKDFAAGLSLRNFSAAENTARTEKYFDLQERAQRWKAKAFHLWLNSMGINMEQLDGLTQLMAGVAMLSKVTAPESQEKSNMERIVESLTQSALLKAHRFKGELLAEMQGKLIEASATPIEEPKKGSKKVQ